MPSFLNFRQRDTNKIKNSKFKIPAFAAPSPKLWSVGDKASAGKQNSKFSLVAKSWLGPIELERVASRVNGEIIVTMAEGRVRFLVGGLTQSGHYIDKIWGKAIGSLKKGKFSPRSCLILGLGGGTVAGLVAKAWPGIKILGVELDPVMIRLGRKYLGLGGVPNLTIIVGDAGKIFNGMKDDFDLILFDVYKRNKVLEGLLKSDFQRKLFTHLTRDGVAVFNLLFLSPEDKFFAERFVSLVGKRRRVKLLRELLNLLVVVQRKS